MRSSCGDATRRFVADGVGMAASALGLLPVADVLSTHCTQCTLQTVTTRLSCERTWLGTPLMHEDGVWSRGCMQSYAFGSLAVSARGSALPHQPLRSLPFSALLPARYRFPRSEGLPRPEAGARLRTPEQDR